MITFFFSDKVINKVIPNSRTITFISLVLQGGSPNYWSAIGVLITQLIIGTVAGLVLGQCMVGLINRINIDNVSFYPILVLTGCSFVFSVTHYLHGNSYLAVYLAGLIVGNSKFVHKRSTRSFFEGISWLCQLTMFLTLGLLVNPSELKSVLVPGLIISVVMIFVTRPLSVFVSLAFFRQYGFKDKVFVSWVGLRGAVPIILAILCKASGIPDSDTIFNIVFLCTLVSLILQGTSLSPMARWLGVSEPPDEKPRIDNFDIEFPEEIKSAASEIEITRIMLSGGSRLMDLGMPEKTLAIMVKRGDNYFVPTGVTQLHVGDKLMILTDNQEALDATLKHLNTKRSKTRRRR